MIQFSKIDAELSIYKEKEVAIFGASSTGKKVKDILEKNGIKIKAVIDNDTKKIGKDFYGIKIYSLSGLQEILSNNYIVQIASVYEREIETQLQEIHADYILYSEFDFRIKELREYILGKKYPYLKKFLYESLWKDYVNTNLQISKNYLLDNIFDDIDYINMKISPAKTGNVSLGKSITGEIFSQMHTYSYISDELKVYLKSKNVNVIMGVRDIISQHISLLFQNVSDSAYYNLDEFWVNGGDVQKIFDKFFVLEDRQEDYWYNYVSIKEGREFDSKIESFFDLQFKPFWNIDIYEYPFEKERGYSVYHIGNLNIMIYQLEKINFLEKEIGEFLKIKNFKLVRVNDSVDKWYLNVYKKAKKELKLDKNYFEKCYSGKFMKHFYSDEDIAIFKEKWKKNVK